MTYIHLTKEWSYYNYLEISSMAGNHSTMWFLPKFSGKKTPGQYFNKLKAIFGKIDIISAISLLI